jgi:hypothetical protein
LHPREASREELYEAVQHHGLNIHHHAQQHLEQQWPGAAVCLWFCTAGHQRTGTVLLRSRRAPANSTRLTAGQPGGPSSTTAGGPASEDGSL